MIRLRLALLAALLVTTSVAAHARPKAAIFPFELIDLSLEGQYIGVRSDETQRLALATQELRKLAARESGYEIVDLTRIAPDIAKVAPLYKCNGCEIELARRAGADVAITLAVRKFSNLLLSFHIYVSDVSNGKLIKMYRVDIRGNTDDVWLHGVRRLVDESLAGG
jgi:hypothetical protein